MCEYIKSKYSYTQSWFLNSEISKVLCNNVDTNLKHNILEIGCFEGLSSVFFSDNLLNNNDSTLTCVDPYYESGTVPGITCKFVNQDVKNRFLENIKKSNNYKKITFHNITSDEFFKTNKKTFNFIYIDGCHENDYIERDITNSFKFLEKNGILWMDDYGGDDGIRIRKLIDSVLQRYDGQYDIIWKGYQIAIRRR